MPTRDELRRGVKADLIVANRVQDRGQRARFAAVRPHLEAIVERANHPAAVVGEAMAALGILDTCDLAEADDERRHNLEAELFNLEEREQRDLRRIQRRPGSLAAVHALAIEIAQYADDPTRVRSLVERQIGHLQDLMGAPPVDRPGPTLRRPC